MGTHCDEEALEEGSDFAMNPLKRTAHRTRLHHIRTFRRRCPTPRVTDVPAVTGDERRSLRQLLDAERCLICSTPCQSESRRASKAAATASTCRQDRDDRRPPLSWSPVLPARPRLIARTLLRDETGTHKGASVKCPKEVEMSDSDRAHLKRFAVLVKSNADVEAGAMPTEQDLAAMTRFNDELVESGAMLAGEGFLASADGARLRYIEEDVRVQTGPFPDPESLVAGYWIIQAASLDEAIDLMKRAPMGGGLWRSGRSPTPRTSARSSPRSCADARNGSASRWRRTPGAEPPEQAGRRMKGEERTSAPRPSSDEGPRSPN